ncbi:peptidase S8/S53 domain-containing protein [Lactarius deliciosus]|nr:peptidase S8/S53 domain-containing protein [Lactarius deliciosus]
MTQGLAKRVIKNGGNSRMNWTRKGKRCSSRVRVDRNEILDLFTDRSLDSSRKAFSSWKAQFANAIVAARDDDTGATRTKLSEQDPKAVTPEYLRWLYKTSANVPAATDENTLGVAAFDNEFASPATALEVFTGGAFRKGVTDATFAVEKVNSGGYDPSNPGIEANLNHRWRYAICGRHRSTNQKGVWLNYMAAKKVIPQTITISIGSHWQEKVPPQQYTAAVCSLFAQPGACSVRVLFASGDDGVGEGDCKDLGKDSSENDQFIPNFPASFMCVPISLASAERRCDKAMRWRRVSLGGGFPDHFIQPDYQDKAVPTFLNGLSNKNSVCSSTQVEATGSPFEGNSIPQISTSCSTPVVAGILSLLNDLTSEGKDPLGFLNPVVQRQWNCGPQRHHIHCHIDWILFDLRDLTSHSPEKPRTIVGIEQDDTATPSRDAKEIPRPARHPVVPTSRIRNSPRPLRVTTKFGPS